jgi:hypothetical protein
MPYITGARKFGTGLHMYSTTLNKYDNNDLHTLLGTVATLTTLGVRYDDAVKLAPHMFMFHGDRYVS